MEKKLLIIICSLLLLTGCSSGLKVYTKDEITSFYEEDYTVYDNDSIMSDIESDNVDITSSINGLKSVTSIGEYDYFLIFYEFDDISNAKEFFDAEKESIQENDTNGAIRKDIKGSNYEKYELTSNGSYYVLIRVENTLIYSDVEEEYKTNIKEMLEKLGY